MLNREIERRLAKLDALEAGGVDNWDYYGEALAEWHKEGELEDLLEGFVENVNDMLAEAHIDEPAGRRCGYSIKFDEDFLKKLLREFIKDYNNM